MTRRPTVTLTAVELDRFIRQHFRFELKTLLCSATTWKAAKDHRLDPMGYLVDMAQDSVFVHARNLYDFMGRGRQATEIRRQFGFTARVRSPMYSRYKDAIHAKNLHVSPGRPFIPSGSHDDRLPEKVVEIATDVLRHWGLLTAEPQLAPYATALKRARDEAVAEATQRAADHGISALFV
jgi:hypothetical protein